MFKNYNDDKARYVKRFCSSFENVPQNDHKLNKKNQISTIFHFYI